MNNLPSFTLAMAQKINKDSATLILIRYRLVSTRTCGNGGIETTSKYPNSKTKYEMARCESELSSAFNRTMQS